MATSPTLYVDSFSSGKPSLVHAAVSFHLSHSKTLTSDLSALLHERLLIEEAYTKALSKLSSRLNGTSTPAVFSLQGSHQASSSSSSREEPLGAAWSQVKRTLVNEVEQTRATHELWRQKISEDVESPLRSSLNQKTWNAYSSAESHFASLVKDFDSASDKVSKAESKGQNNGSKASKGPSSKFLTAQSNLSTINSQLQSQLPHFLTLAQAVDTTHSAFLKEALVRYGTFGSDLGRERMEMGERVLVSVLGVDEGVEMESWAVREGLKAGGAGGGVGRSSNSESGSDSMMMPTQRNEFGMRETAIQEEEDRGGLAAPVTTRQRVPSITTAPPPVAPLPLPSPANVSSISKSNGNSSSSGSGGFKLSSLLPGSSSKNRDRSNSSSTNQYGNLDNNNFNSTPSSPPLPLPPPTIGADRQSLESRDSSVGGSGTQRPNLSSATSFGSNSTTTTNKKKRDSIMPSFGSGGGGGGLFRRASKAPQAASSQFLSSSSPSTGTGGMGMQLGNGSDVYENPPPQQQRARVDSTMSAASEGREVDAEGYSLPPKGYDRQIGAGSGVTAERNLMDDDDDDHGFSGSVAPLSTVKLPTLAPTTITESESSRLAALSAVQSTLSSSITPQPRRSNTVRGRRVTTQYNPTIPDDVPLGRLLNNQAGSGGGVPHRQDSGGPFSTTSPPPESPTTFDRASSITSSTHGAQPHLDPFSDADPPASSTALQASIVETVNAIFAPTGEIQKLAVTGSISVRGGSGHPTRFVLQHPEEMDKVAPNRAVLQEVPSGEGEGGEGEFEVTLGSAAHTGEGTTVLKYQRKVFPGTEEDTAPLLLKTAWQVGETETKVIIYYEAKEDLSNVVAEIPFPSSSTTTNVTSVRAKPTAARFDSARGKLVWELGDLKKGEGGKALAAIGTEGQATRAAVEVKWAIQGRCIGEIGVAFRGQEGAVVSKRLVSGKYAVGA